jgi:hypothetical protein
MFANALGVILAPFALLYLNSEELRSLRNFAFYVLVLGVRSSFKDGTSLQFWHGMLYLLFHPDP